MDEQEFRMLTREEVRDGMLRDIREECGDEVATWFERISPPCQSHSRAGERRETHTVTYDGQTIIVTHHNGSRAEVPRTSNLGRELTDALFESLRLASLAPLESAPADPARAPVLFDDDPEGDNWTPPGVEEGDTATCRRCGKAITWSFDIGNDGAGNPVVSTETGFWYGDEDGTEACIPGPDDADRYHAPTSTPTPEERGEVSRG